MPSGAKLGIKNRTMHDTGAAKCVHNVAVYMSSSMCILFFLFPFDCSDGGDAKHAAGTAITERGHAAADGNVSQPGQDATTTPPTPAVTAGSR
jgi:hypothetical protein